MADNEIIKIYTGGPRVDVRVLPMLAEHFSRTDSTGQLFKDFFGALDFSFLQLVDDPARADFLFIPHDYFVMKRAGVAEEVLAEFEALAREHGKKIILIAHGDSDEDISLENGYIFRTSQYGYKKRANEVIMPPYVEDLFGGEELLARGKSEKPVVSFCGWAGFKSRVRYLKYIVKLAVQYVKYALGSTHALVHRQGMYFRRQLLALLKKSERVKTCFIIRRSYSGHKNTISLSESEARKEYIENIKESDFVLAPKGDGNYSMRFYEALALGRFPVLLDTDVVLPQSERIDYEKIAVIVPYSEMAHTSDKIADFYDTLSESDLGERQRQARQAFERYLRIDSFLQTQLNRLKTK